MQEVDRHPTGHRLRLRHPVRSASQGQALGDEGLVFAELGVVGERGPEIVTGPATVFPNSSLRGGGGGSSNIYITVSGARGDSEVREMVRQGVSQGIRASQRDEQLRFQQHQLRFT